jgi:hypothetical protein
VFSQLPDTRNTFELHGWAHREVTAISQKADYARFGETKFNIT